MAVGQDRESLSPTQLLQLQRTVGNRAAVQLLRDLTPPAAGPAAPPRTSATFKNSSPIQRVKVDDKGNRAGPSWDSPSWAPPSSSSPSPETHDTEDIPAFRDWLRAQPKNVVLAVQRTLAKIPSPSRGEAIAASLVRLMLTEQRPDSGADNAMSRLPKDQWWQLFIDKGAQSNQDSNEDNALRFDRESSPGYYNAMMTAYENHLEGVRPGTRTPTSPGDLVGMHHDVAHGTLKEGEPGHFEPMPEQFSGPNTSYGIVKNYEDQPSLTGAREMAEEGLLGLHREAARAYAGRTIAPSQEARTRFLIGATKASGSGEFASRMHPLESIQGHTYYERETVPDRVDAILGRYATEIAKTDKIGKPAARQQAKLRTIVQAIRALHVGHFFEDANGRLNTMLLLNKFLLEEGFLPVIMDSTAGFGGAFSIDQLVGQVVRGMRTFGTRTGTDGPTVRVHRPYEFFTAYEDLHPADRRVSELYVIELDLAYVPTPFADEIQSLLRANRSAAYQVTYSGSRIYKLGFTTAKPFEALEHTLETYLQ